MKIFNKAALTRNARQLFALPFIAFLLVFVVFPLLLLLYFGFFEQGDFSLQAVRIFLSDGYSMKILWRSLWIALLVTIVCVLVGYPIAYALSMTDFKNAGFILLLFIMPMWINSLLRTIATKELLSIFTQNFGLGTLVFGLVCEYIPFMIMPIYSVMNSINKSYIEAARDLGAKPHMVLLKVVLPLSVPGIISGFLMVFTPTISTYFISDRLGNSFTTMFGELINEFYGTRAFGQGSIASLVLLIIVGLSVFLTSLTKIGNKRGGLW